jgi:hypothetical protein
MSHYLQSLRPSHCMSDYSNAYKNGVTCNCNIVVLVLASRQRDLRGMKRQLCTFVTRAQDGDGWQLYAVVALSVKWGFCAHCGKDWEGLRTGWVALSQTFDCRAQLKCDGIRWRTGGEVKGKLATWVGSQYSSHYLGTWCIQHYYRWCAHLGCQQSTELTPPPI